MNYKRSLFFSAILICLSSFTFCQSSSEIVEKKSIKLIKEFGMISTGDFGEGSYFPAYDNLRDSLIADYSIAELVELVKTHESELVVGYSFWALSKQDYTELSPLMEIFLEDNKRTVMVDCGCYRLPNTIFDYMSIVMSSKSTFFKGCYQISNDELIALKVKREKYLESVKE